MSFKPINIIFCTLFFLVTPEVHAEHEKISLIAFIDLVQEQGESILYSSALITKEMSAPADPVSIDSLELALSKYDLELIQNNDFWVIKLGAIQAMPLFGSIERSNGSPIFGAYARVAHNETTSYADTNGQFELTNIPVGSSIIVGAPGFEDRIVQAGNGNIGKVILTPEPLLESMLVTGSHYRVPVNSAQSTAFNLSSEAMNNAPALAGDAMRITNRLPGVSSVGVSAQPKIRGGLGDEVLILYDGVELIEPFHLADYQAALSSIDHRTVASMDVYTGGFPVRYGNHMSGVIDVQTSSPQPGMHTEIGASNFSQFVTTQGKFDSSMPLAWSFSARRGDLEELTQFIDTRAEDPQYIDITAKFSAELGSQTDLSVGIISTDEDVRFENEEESASSIYDTQYLWLKLDTKLNKQLQSSFVLSVNELDRAKRADVFEPDLSKAGFTDYLREVEITSLRNTYLYSSEEFLLEFGVEAAFGSADYSVQTDYFDTDILATFLGTETVVRNTTAQPSGWSTGAFIGAEISWSEFTFHPAIRWDIQNYYFSSPRQQTSPRLGITYAPSDNAILRFNLGRFNQPEGIHELQVADGADTFSEPQSADYLALGSEWGFDKFSVSAEAYYKGYRNPKARYENYFDPFVLIPELEPDRVTVTPDKAMTRGLDLSLDYQFSPELHGTLRYSYMEAEDRINGVWIPRRWSQNDSWNSQITWQCDSFSLSAAIAWHSGWNSSSVPSPVDNNAVVPIEDILNNRVLRNYLSVDLGARKTWQIGRSQLTLHADIANATDRGNAAGIDYDVEETGGQLEFIPESEVLLPVIASVGFVLSF